MRGHAQTAHRFGMLWMMVVAVAAIASGCGPTMDEEVDAQDQGLFVIIDREALTAVQELLGPADDGGSRVVDGDDSRAILSARDGELQGLSQMFHERYRRCGGFTTHSTLAAARATLRADAIGPVQNGVSAPLELAEPEVVGQLIPLVDESRILDTITQLSSFPTRHYQSTSGVEAAEWLRDRWTELAASRPGATVELFPHASWLQPSVVMTIPGDDLSDEVVVIGGHLDSISGGSVAPGADDDASGVATLTEVAQVLLAQDIHLRRTVSFMAYAGEEAGLRGSAEIAADYAARGVPVVGVMQLDMTNYDGSQFDIVLITDNVDPAQTDFLGELATTYLPQFPLSSDACGYACSDHASWTRNGFPSVLPFEATMSTYNPTIHTPNDTLAVSDNNASHASKFAKLGVAYIVEMAEVPDGEEPPPATSVRLAQVAYDVPGLDRLGEFVDIENTGDAPASLAGWQLSNGTSTWTFPAGATVAAGGFASVASSASGFTSLYGEAPEIGGVSISLPNGSGELFLIDPTGTEVDHVGWERTGWSLFAATGMSIVRTAAEDTDVVADWQVAATDPRGVSPLSASR